LLVGAPEDDFVVMYYTGYEIDQDGNIVRDNLEWSARELMEMNDAERRYLVPTSPKTVYKDSYFDSMFYKTYIGPAAGSPGALSEASFQVPCLYMKHFYAEFISDISNPFYQYHNSGKAAVVIAKYYEGAFINGTVTFNGEPLDAQVIVQKNLTYYSELTIPIDHDKEDTFQIAEGHANGTFNLLAGAGSRLQIIKNLGSTVFVYTNVTFEGANGTEYAPIIDDDAMRRDGSNYERILNISIEPASFEGNLYEDVDNDGSYNSSVDIPLSDGELIIYEIANIADDQIQPGDYHTLEINGTTGRYNISDVLPGLYRIVLTRDDDYIVHLNDIGLYSGNTVYDIAEPLPAKVTGTIYYNKDDDVNLTAADEKIDKADVELLLPTSTGGQRSVANTTSDKGLYEFDSLIPGQFNNYIIKATKDDLYVGEISVTLEANKTSLATVAVSGLVKHGENPVEVTLTFTKDETKADNTADIANSTTSAADGSYTIDLTPGDYNVTVEKISGDVLVYELTDGKLTIEKGNGTSSKNYFVEKKSTTVSGTTSYEGTNIANVTATWINNESGATNTGISDSTGLYSIELFEGNWTITAVSEQVNESGELYTYKTSAPLSLKIPSVTTFDIRLMREAVITETPG